MKKPMTFAQTLRLVRPLIESGKEDYICTAIQAVCAGESSEHISAKRRRVMRQLAGESTYEVWLATRHPNTWPRMTFLDVIDGRLQWIDHMLKQEETHG